MLNVKKTLTKILGLFKEPDLIPDFAWSSPWTAPYSGILVIRVQRQSGAAGAVTFYVKDTTASVYGLGALATGAISGNFQNTMSFPVIKGHIYETEYTSGVGTLTCRLYRIPSWGGVIRTLKNAISNLYREGVATC